MRRVLLLATSIFLLCLTACGGGGGSAESPESVALEFASNNGFAEASVTDVVEGDPATVGADAIFCVATDATDDASGLPFLVIVEEADGALSASQMAEGYYEWDLYACPR